jgi:hypothetical protein
MITFDTLLTSPLCIGYSRMGNYHLPSGCQHYRWQGCNCIPVHSTCIWCIYITAYSICKSLLDIRSVFGSRQPTNQQVDVTGVSIVSFTGSFTQILWSLQQSCLLIQPFFGPHAVWYVLYQSLSRSWHTDLDHSSYRLSNVEIGLTAGVSSQQGMLTPPWYLIPPLIHSEVRVRPFWFAFSLGLMRLITVHYFCPFFQQFGFPYVSHILQHETSVYTV